MAPFEELFFVFIASKLPRVGVTLTHHVAVGRLRRSHRLPQLPQASRALHEITPHRVHGCRDMFRTFGMLV